MKRFTVDIAAIDTSEAVDLMEALSQHLAARYGSDGKASFAGWVANDPRYVFAIARCDGQAVGCGAIRPMGQDTGEVKRMHAIPGFQGAGSSVLSFLEREAVKRKYRTLKLETRLANKTAIAFYLKHGYALCENFGQYAGRSESVCLEKHLNR